MYIHVQQPQSKTLAQNTAVHFFRSLSLFQLFTPQILYVHVCTNILI